MTTLVLGTRAAGDGGATAALELEGTTVLARVLAQLAALGAGDDVRVLTRPALRASVESALGAAAGADTTTRAAARVVVSDSLAGDLRAVEAPPREGGGPVVVVCGDVVTQGAALAALLDDPRPATAALAGPAGEAGACALRAGGGRVLAAASARHGVRRPTGSFRGVLRVAAEDRAALAGAAARIAALDGLPADADAASLLLVALVRGGTPVRAADAPAYPWARPTTAADAARAAERLRAADEERLRLDSAVKATDGWFTTFLVSPYSRHLARWAARRGLTPDQVTTASLALGVLAAAAFAGGERWGLIAGAVLLQVSFTTDCVDGQLARYTRRFSTLGAWLDAVFDRTKEYAVYAGLAIGAERAGDPLWVLAAAALTLQTVRHMIDFSWAARVEAGEAPLPPLEAEWDEPAPREAGRGEAAPHEAGRGEPAPREAGRGEAAPRKAAPQARALAAWQGSDAVPAVLWLRKIVALPIGERFAAISLTAALFDARVTFVVLLAWGSLALAYGLLGRGLRTVAR